MAGVPGPGRDRPCGRLRARPTDHLVERDRPAGLPADPATGGGGAAPADRTAARAADRPAARLPEQPPAHLPGQPPGNLPGRSPAELPGRPLTELPGRSPAPSPGRAVERVPEQTSGDDMRYRAADDASGPVFGRASGRPAGPASDPASGPAPGRPADRVAAQSAEHLFALLSARVPGQYSSGRGAERSPGGPAARTGDRGGEHPCAEPSAHPADRPGGPAVRPSGHVFADQPVRPGCELPPEHREAAALLADGAERARSGMGGLVLLRGATGTGRTTVLEAAARDAAAHGMRVLRARCAPGDGTVPYATALQLLGPVPGLGGPGEQGAPGGPGAAGDEREPAELLRRALHAYAARSPVLIAVDDVHLADGHSHRWLVETARHLDRLALPVLLAVTERSQYDVDTPRPGFTHTLSPALTRTHTLAPLTPGAAGALVRARFPAATRTWAENCVRAGAGSPLLLRALLDDLGDPARHPIVPETAAALYPGAYQAAVSWWLDSAGSGTAEVARILAVLDDGWSRPGAAGGADRPGPGAADAPGVRPAAVPGPRAADGPAVLLAELSGADPVRVTGWLTAMTGLGLLRTGPGGRPRYAHPLLRDAVLTGVPESRRRATHLAAAQAMLHRGASAETVARHLLLAGPVGASWTAGVLQDAASLALREGRPQDAMAFLRRALDEPLPGARRQRLLTELGSLECAAHESAAGIPRLTEAFGLPGGPQDRVRAAVALGTALAGSGRPRAAVEVLCTAVGQLPDRPELVAALHSASALLSDRDQTVRREVYRLLRDTAERSSEPVGTVVRALFVRHAATAGRTSAADAMRRVRELLAEPADPLTEPFLLGTTAAVAQWADELDEADRLVDRGLAGQRPGLLHPMHEALLNTRADVAAARGTHGRLPAEPPGVHVTGPGNIHAHILLALVEQGRTAEARRLADGFDLRTVPGSWELNRFLYARGVQRAAAGDTAGALHDFLECGRRQSAREVISPVVTPWRSAAAECRLALGSPLEALELAEEELRLARVWGTPRTIGRSLRVLGAVTGGRRGLELAEEAVHLLRQAPPGAAPELVSALLAQGRQLTAAGELVRARACLREAAERAERLGAPRLWTLTEQALRAGGARRTAGARTGSGSLTGSERRIAQLAADGRTNTEIAALLHLARRTVETHLTSTYKKLGIRRRGQLREAMAGE
ncbi:AAA family ATPase [Streptomyces andamanensis]|uniref:AAA family ATPase n=1 Tax=Streptomyces andamanensis TaxID=1565035 RepID=A0ABV8TIU5_9ACTN